MPFQYNLSNSIDLPAPLAGWMLGEQAGMDQYTSALDAAKKLLENQKSEQSMPFELQKLGLEGAQAQIQNTPEMLKNFVLAKQAQQNKAIRENEIGAASQPGILKNIPVQQAIEAQQLDTQNQISQIDRLINSGGVDQFGNQATPEQIAAWQKERDRLVNQLAASPEQRAKLDVEKAKAEAAYERADLQTQGAKERAVIGAGSRTSAADIAAIARVEAQRLANEARIKTEEMRLNKIKDIPASAVKEIVKNNVSLHKIEDALVELQQHPDAFGVKGYIADEALQRIDPEGVKARAIISDIGSLKVHDRSGATVTAAEYPRLKPFIPRITDNPEVIKTKLSQFYAELHSANKEYEEMYSKGRGYPGTPAETPPQQSQPVQKTIRYDNKGNVIK